MSKYEAFDNKDIISKIINNLMNAMHFNIIDVYDKRKTALNLFPSMTQHFIDDLSQVSCDIVYVSCDGCEEWNKIKNKVKARSRVNYVLYLRNIDFGKDVYGILGKGASLKYFGDANGRLYLFGETFEGPKDTAIPSDFRVLAITHVYNEIDAIDKLCKYLFEQGIDVYFVDNWSTDGTYERLRELKDQFSNIVEIERFPKTERTESFEWYKQLERTEEVSKEQNYQWYLHYDADEMRIPPWENVTLKQAIHHADRCGYNQIGMYTIIYKLTDYDEDNIFMKDTYFEFGNRSAHYAIKMWKKSNDIDLKKSGGHLAEVKNPRCFPLMFLNRHYPFRSLEQAQKKVFKDRKPRFQKERKEKGWHGHYDKLNSKDDFISDKEELFLWDKDSVHDFYVPFFCNCGIKLSDYAESHIDKVSGFDKEDKDIIIFGAGLLGKVAFLKYAYKNNVVAWVDSNYAKMDSIFGTQIQSPEKIRDFEFDYILIAINNKAYVREVMEELSKLGIQGEKTVLLKWGNGE